MTSTEAAETSVPETLVPETLVPVPVRATESSNAISESPPLSELDHDVVPGDGDNERDVSTGDVDNEDADASDLVSEMFRQQNMVNYAMYNSLLSTYLTHEDKNVASQIDELRASIDITSRCLLKLCDTVEGLGHRLEKYLNKQ